MPGAVHILASTPGNGGRGCYGDKREVLILSEDQIGQKKAQQGHKTQNQIQYILAHHKWDLAGILAVDLHASVL